MSAVGHVMLGTMDVHHHWTKVRKSLKAKESLICHRHTLVSNCVVTSMN